MAVVVALDSGTTATRAVAVDGSVVATAEAGYSLRPPRPRHLGRRGLAFLLSLIL